MANKRDDRLEYRRARGGATVAKVRALVKREGSHICWLCGYAIDMEIDVNDRMGWTMDHIVPLHIDPSRGLDIDNIREAHRACNSARGKGAPRPRVIGSRKW